MSNKHAPWFAAALIVIVMLIVGYIASSTMRATPPVQSPPTAPSKPPVSGGGCIVGGCSRETCTDESEGPMMSPCIFKPEFACYKTATCERQSNGMCGWTPTAQLKSCLQNPPSAQ